MTSKGPGPLVVIGGAEDKIGRSVVLRRFVRLAGGRGNARIVVVPTASSVEPEMVAVYTDLFTRLGATEVRAVRPVSRATADDPALAAETATATGIFMTGGNQLKLSQILTGTALGDAIHAAHSRGAVIGGTSAGASMMSSHMISLGGEGVTPRHRSSQLSAGLGLIDGVVVDQHFDQRSRYGRLMSLVATSPNLLGIGIDENTAAVITEKRWMEVVGAGAVFVLDARHATSDAHEARGGRAADAVRAPWSTPCRPARGSTSSDAPWSRSSRSTPTTPPRCTTPTATRRGCWPAACARPSTGKRIPEP